MVDDNTLRNALSHLPACALLAVALGGCGIASDYTLTLNPRTLPGQDPFGTDVTVKVLLYGEDGASEVVPLDDAEGVRPLDGDRVGVVVELLGGPATEFNRFSMAAYGEVGPISLGSGEVNAAYDVFVPMFGVVGDMDAFADSHHLAAAAMLPKGGVILAGGGDLDSGATDDGIYWMRHPDTEPWRLDPIATMQGPRAGATASLVEVDGISRVLIAGGRASIDDITSNRRQAILFDPAYERVGWRGDMSVRRSGHAAVTLESGKVLLIGGWVDDGLAPDQATFDIFDPATRTMTAGPSPLNVPSVGLAVASIGSDGALVCGGGTLSGDTLTPSRLCDRISLTGQVSAAAPMLGDRMGHALVQMEDGSVLLTGGIDSATDVGDQGQSISTASLYIPREDSWDQIGPMELRRVGHTLVSTGDGRYIAIGGAETGDGASAYGAAVDCTELFDPSNFRWTVQQPCNPTGRGAAGAVASHAEHGAFALTGYDPSATSGRAYGWLGFGPALLASEE